MLAPAVRIAVRMWCLFRVLCVSVVRGTPGWIRRVFRKPLLQVGRLVWGGSVRVYIFRRSPLWLRLYVRTEVVGTRSAPMEMV